MSGYCSAILRLSRSGQSRGLRRSGNTRVASGFTPVPPAPIPPPALAALSKRRARRGCCCVRGRREAVRTWARTSAGSAHPIHPASWRAYSLRRVWSWMSATMGTARRSAWRRPSTESRGKSAIMARTTNSNMGTRRATRSRTAASPCARRRSQGSMPAGATDT